MEDKLTKQDRKFVQKVIETGNLTKSALKQIGPYKTVRINKDSKEAKAILRHYGPSIYVIKCHNYYKIGTTSNDIVGRVGGLQVGNPYELEIVFCYKGENAKTLEKKLHERFKHRNVRGEWFEFNEKDLGEFENFIEDNW